jgi:hypothetical protein
MIKLLIFIVCLGFAQNAFAQGLGEQSAYRGGQGSGYAVNKVTVTIGPNGDVESDFAKPQNQLLSENNAILFTDTLGNYTVSAFSSEGKQVKFLIKNNEVQLLGNLKTGIYWVTLARSGKKEVYKVIKG